MSEDLSAVDGAQLARWAYGRPADAAEADRARRAAIELERRAPRREAAKTPHGPDESTIGTPATTPLIDEAHPDSNAAEGVDSPPPHRRRRIVTAGILISIAVVAGFALPPVFDPPEPPRSSLDVFDRGFTDVEREYLAALQREGQLVSVGPRVIGDIEFGTVMAYRSIRNNPGQPERDQVCLAVAEYNRAAQSPQINDWQCVDRADFEREGTSVTLFGLGGQYDVDWGPSGRAQIDVIMTEAQRRVMDPGLEGTFLDFPPRELDGAYVDDQLLLEQTGLIVEQLRTVFPLGELLGDPTTDQPSTITADAEWLAAYTAAPVNSNDRVACLAVLAAGVQRESRCVPLDEDGGRGFLLEIEREGTTVVVSWEATGEISAQTATTD